MNDELKMTYEQQVQYRTLLNSVADVEAVATILCRRGAEFERRYRRALGAFEAASSFLCSQNLKVSAMVTVVKQGATHNSTAPGERFYLSYSRRASGHFGIHVCAYATAEDTDAPFLPPNEAAPAVLVFLAPWLAELMLAVEKRATDACAEPVGWRSIV